MRKFRPSVRVRAHTQQVDLLIPTTGVVLRLTGSNSIRELPACCRNPPLTPRCESLARLLALRIYFCVLLSRDLPASDESYVRAPSAIADKYSRQGSKCQVRPERDCLTELPFPSDYQG